jgi:MFS transporter, UMF1 family
MQATLTPPAHDDRTYRRQINAWVLYDVANSAFFTTIIAAVMPTYYSAVAGATLPSAAIATRNWSLSLSIALTIAAVMSPVLGTISDIVRGKKVLLSVFVGVGVLATGGLVLVGTGDWLLASALIVIGRIGVAGSNIFYDALLPHIANDEDQDAVSARGYAMGYLGGGILLALNVVMIEVIPDDVFGFPFEFAGVRLSLLSVAIWWAAFTLPLLLRIPEPPGITDALQAGQNVIQASFAQLAETLQDLRRYSELFKFLVAFLIYNDGIGTIIGVAVIYGAELGFDTTQLILALLLVQFVGIPFSFIFGNLPNPAENRRRYYLGFVIANAILLPLVGVSALRLLPAEITGAPPAPYTAQGEFLGEGVYTIDDIRLDGSWATEAIEPELLGTDQSVSYALSVDDDATYSLPFNGRRVQLTYATGPDFGSFAVALDGAPLLDDGEPVVIDASGPAIRYGVTTIITAPTAGQHTLQISGDSPISVAQVEVLPPERGGDLLVIIGALLATQAVAIGIAWALGGVMRPLADQLNTKRTVLLALVIYGMIAIWGYFVNSTVEFWFLAWMVAVVQGGSQALSRSLYASMSPKEKSGEFFGLFSVMSKFSAIFGPLLFAGAVTLFGNSRPAILSLIALFIIGGYLLTRVDVSEGRRVAQAESGTA